MPLSVEELLEISRLQGLEIRWFDGEASPGDALVRARFEAPGTVLLNQRLLALEDRLKYDLAFFIGHKILHNGDGLISPHSATQSGEVEPAATTAGMGAQDVLYAWRDFECSFFAGALLCPRIPFRRFLIREAHSVSACTKLGVTPALVMRRMTAVSPYRHWHFFDAYPPGFLRAVYRANGIPLPWGNMSLVSDPCPRWAVFRLLHQTPATTPTLQKPKSQISIMQDGKRARLYCCHSLLTRDALDAVHVLSVGRSVAGARSTGLRRRWHCRGGCRVLSTRRRRRGDTRIRRAVHSRGLAGAQHRLDRGRARCAGLRDLPAQRRVPPRAEMRRLAANFSSACSRLVISGRIAARCACQSREHPESTWP
jgi:hypothetical protein